MATSEMHSKKSVEAPSKPMNFAAFLKSVDTQTMSPANTPEVPLLLTNQVANDKTRSNKLDARLLQATGVIISTIWLVGAALYVQRTVGWNNVSALMPHELGGFLAGILTPIALFWMIAAFVLRSNDVKLYADALREEIQAMIFPSDEANRRVNNDIERLMRQTSEMSKATKEMLSVLSSARTGVRDQITELQMSSTDTVTRLTELSKRLALQSQSIVAVKDTMEDALQSFDDRTQDSDHFINKLVTANQQLLQQSQLINQTTTTTEAATARLADMLRERISELATIHTDTEQALKNAGDEIARQRQGLRVEAEAIEEKAMGIATTLDKSTEKLYNFTDDTLDKARLIETRLLGQLSSIENVLSSTQGLSQSIETATNAAAEKLQASSDYAVERSGKVHTVLEEAIQRLQDKTTSTMTNFVAQVSTTSENALRDIEVLSQRTTGMTDTMLSSINTKVADVTSAFGAIQAQIQTVATLFDQRKGDLDQAGINAHQMAQTLDSVLQGAMVKVQDTTKAMQEGIASINTSIQQPFAMLENASVLADQRAKELVTLLETKATTLTSAASQIGNHVNTLHDQLHGKGQDVALLAGKIATHLKTVTEQLNTQQTTLDQKIQHSVLALQGVGVELDASGARVTGLSETTLTALQAINQNLNSSVGTLQTLTQTQVAFSEDLTKTEARLGLVSDRFVHISGKTVDKIKETLEDLTLLEADYHRLSDAGVENIQRLEQGYRGTLDTIQQSTQQSMSQLQQQVDTLRSTNTDISLTADQAILKVAKVQEAGQNVFGVLQNIASQAKQADEDLNLVSSHISVHINTIGDAMKRAEGMTNQSIERFVQQGNTLQTKVQEAQAGIHATSDNTTNLVTRIQQQMRQIRLETESVEKTMGQSVTRMVEQTAHIDVAATKLMDKVNRAQGDLIAYGKHIEVSGDDIVSRLKQAMSQMSDRAIALEKAAVVAQQQAEALRAQEAKLKRDTFFSSTKFVVESLHSLALDFTRLLDGELPEKTWKSYQKGDLGAFTRRLLNARDEETQQKIRYKFKEDLEFRTYAQRYLRQFEEIYDSASANDHADLLTTVFLTSDVGKLYQFLCTVLERDKRGTEKV
jgi:ABC-type transporter Mla subunit MlaD